MNIAPALQSDRTSKRVRENACNAKTSSGNYPNLQPVLVARSPRSLEPNISRIPKTGANHTHCRLFWTRKNNQSIASRTPCLYNPYTQPKNVQGDSDGRTLPMLTRPTPPNLQSAASSSLLPRLLPLRTASVRCPVGGGPILRSPVESRSRTCSWAYLVCSQEVGAGR